LPVAVAAGATGGSSLAALVVVAGTGLARSAGCGMLDDGEGAEMAAPVKSQRDLARRIAAVRMRPEAARPRLLAFFLFDERSSQRKIRSFVNKEFSWLDSLARSSNIILFFFSETEPGHTNGKNDVVIVEGNPRSANPSLDVAAKFGISPDQLPGIVFFRDLNFESEESPQGIYWRIPLESFREDQDILEREIARLFSLVQNARHNSADTTSMFDELKKALEGMRRLDTNEAFMALIGRSLIRVVTYPGKLIEAFIIAFGEGAGGAAVSKYT
jgi:hypothetical protein